MKIRDLQFVKYFLTEEVDYNLDDYLDKEIQIKHRGDPDIITTYSDRVEYQNPSSITMFLFNTLYHLLSPLAVSEIQQDKLGLGLLYTCRNYVYADHSELKHADPSIIVDFDKLSVPSSIIREIVEPLVGKLKILPVLFMPCNFTDTCRIITSSYQLEEEYNMVNISSSFPLILCNSKVHNFAAQYAHLVLKMIESSTDAGTTSKIIKNILLKEEGDLISSLVLILKTLNGNPLFVVDFLKYLDSGASLTTDEQEIVIKYHQREIEKDSYLSKLIKTAAPKYTPEVWHQWSQWSMLMGLIEKQLDSMRGSMWPTSERVKPHEDKLRLLIKKRTEEKSKNQANFEEMLEAARDLYDHNAVEPGKLIETLLKRNRVWKQ